MSLLNFWHLSALPYDARGLHLPAVVHYVQLDGSNDESFAAEASIALGYLEAS